MATDAASEIDHRAPSGRARGLGHKFSISAKFCQYIKAFENNRPIDNADFGGIDNGDMGAAVGWMLS